MATYKVPQDVEAEDKLLGPLTFRQFIYAMVGAGLSFFSYLGFKAHWSIGVVPLPFIIIFMILAFYNRDDQPIEAFVVAFLRFLFLPRRRIWNRKNHNTYVKITAPKRKPQQRYRSASEARNQLKNLAQIVDTRGWSSKQSELQLPTSQKGAIPLDDRLVVPDFRAHREPVDVHNTDDVFEEGNKTADVFNQLSQNAQDSTRQEAINKMQAAIQAAKKGSNESAHTPTQEDSSQPPAKEPRFNPYPEGFHPKKVVQPVGSGENQNNQSGMTKEQRADILELSQNDGLSLEELAKHAQRVSEQNQQKRDN